MRPRWLWLAALIASGCVGAGELPLSEPIWVENLSPVSGLISLPPQRSGVVPDGWRIDSHVAIANHFVVDGNTDQSLVLDGETTRLSLALEYGWRPNWSARVTLPWVGHDGGFLDSAIDGWHDFFGMDDGGRAGFPRDQIRYLRAGPGEQFDLMEGRRGLGDIRFELNHGFYRSSDRAASLTLGYKAASGSDDDFTGSSSSDVFATLRVSGAPQSTLPLSWHAQAGYTRAGESTLLGEGQRRGVWFAGLGLGWQFAGNWSVLAQFDSHAAPLHSPLDALGSASGLLSLGLRFQPSENWSVDVSFVEDIIVATAPDITFQASLRWRPGSR